MAALASLALVGVLLVGPAAAAATPEARALALLDRGIEAFRAGDYAAARRAFDGARRLAPGRANAYRWLGLTEVRLGDCAQALIDFEIFLRAVPATDERVPEVIRQRDACRAAPAAGTSAAATAQQPPAALGPASIATGPASIATGPASIATGPAAPLATPPPPAATARRSIARRWWFWTALGVVAAGAAAGIALGVLYARPRESRFPSILCDMAGCRPGAP